jgi:hypothetical protein
MPNFRCYFMDQRSHVVFSADVNAADLNAAKHQAFDVLHAEDMVRSSTVHGLEIWQGKTRLYPEAEKSSTTCITSRC